MTWWLPTLLGVGTIITTGWLVCWWFNEDDDY